MATSYIIPPQQALTFDSAPTSGSNNPVKSGGVFNAVNGKNLKTYYLGSQLGLTGGDYKPLDIVQALPDNSIFVSAPGSSYSDLASPATGVNEWIYNGTVLVFKKHFQRHIVLNFYGTATNSSTQKFAVSRAYSSSGTYAMTPWTVYDDGSNVAIVASGTTAPQAIASGQYVVWQGSLYTANSNIASEATLSTSNLTAVSDGGLNSLLSQFKNWTSFDAQIYDNNTATGVSFTNAYYTKIGNFVFMCGQGIGSELTLSTMLQIRNLPCNSVWAGGIYLAGITGNCGDRTLQSTTSARAYFRPNITGTISASTTPSFWLIGQAT